jgi:hypothetical protein
MLHGLVEIVFGGFVNFGSSFDFLIEACLEDLNQIPPFIAPC